jgi:5-methylcytosine-specific restriction endonuclease McrA
MDVEDSFRKLAQKFDIPQRPDPSQLTRRCYGCGQPFVTRQAEQRYCTPACKAQHKGRRGKPEPRRPSRVDYQGYIRSDIWRRKADAAKKRAGYRCQVCNRGAHEVVQLEVHHRTYERLGAEEPGDLTVLCETCHDIFTRAGTLAKVP